MKSQAALQAPNTGVSRRNPQSRQSKSLWILGLGLGFRVDFGNPEMTGIPKKVLGITRGYAVAPTGKR